MDPQTSPQPQQPAALEPRPMVNPEAAIARPEIVPAPVAPEMAPMPSMPPSVQPQAVVSAPVHLPLPPQPLPVVPATNQPVTVGPMIADDVDVIEKEWVDKAQDIVRATADDPYAEEEAVENLQIDYLKKRYGKEIDKPS